MRQLASYSLEAHRGEGPSAARPEWVHGRVDEWLSFKGTPTAQSDALVYRDGRVAALERTSVSSSVGRIEQTTLIEPTEGGTFRTTVAVAEATGLIAVSVVLAAASQSLSPISLDVHCPRVVGNLLRPPSPWRHGATRVTSSPVDFDGYAGGDRFVSLVWSGVRSLPVVAVSDDQGAVLHPGIVEGLARDLAGLAVVARLDPAASWRVSKTKGKEWSCYNGAIRLYWPGLAADEGLDPRAGAEPRDYPLWTPSRLLTEEADTRVAAGKLRSQLRRRVLGQSAFAISEPPVFAKIRRSARQEELEVLKGRLSPDADYKALAEDYFEQLARRHAEIEERDAEIADLRGQVSNLQLAFRWKDETPGAVEPDAETPPETVEEAVLTAMDRHHGELVFGAAVDSMESVETVAADAGGPTKILRYLEVLAEFTRARREGALGKTAVKWLEDAGVAASGESDTIKNNPKERSARQWDDGSGETRYFDMHLKPNEATSPDRCVRIYFDYDEDLGKTVVGWVGKHP